VSAVQVVWEDPPSVVLKQEGSSILAVVPQLKERPGQWARVWTGGSSGHTRRAKILRDAGCETAGARSGGPGSGTRHLYARWPE
jgi:hypothetical protein